MMYFCLLTLVALTLRVWVIVDVISSCVFTSDELHITMTASLLRHFIAITLKFMHFLTMSFTSYESVWVLYSVISFLSAIRISLTLLTDTVVTLFTVIILLTVTVTATYDWFSVFTNFLKISVRFWIWVFICLILELCDFSSLMLLFFIAL